MSWTEAYESILETIKKRSRTQNDILVLAFDVGRCSAIHEYCDFKHGRLRELSDDIVSYLKDYDKE